MTSEWRYTRWALGQVADRSAAPDDQMAQLKIQALVDALAALRGRGGAQIFGLSADRIEPGGREEVEAAVVETLVGWKGHFAAANDAVSLLALDEVGSTFGVASLRMQDAVRLRSDPLGSRDGLSAAWLARLDRLEQAKNGVRTLDLAAVQYVGAEEEDEDPVVEFGPPDPKALHKHALRHEAVRGAGFPRELAAFWSVANGISIDGDPLLYPVAGWEYDIDGQLSVGCGGYMQGSLVFADPPGEADLMRAAVIDRDDDGQERAHYADFAAFVDALLGT